MPNADDLQRILAARFDWEHADLEDKPDREKFYRELFDAGFREASAARPLTSRHSFLDAIDKRYKLYRSERRRKEMGSVPPNARGE